MDSNFPGLDLTLDNNRRSTVCVDSRKFSCIHKPMKIILFIIMSKKMTLIPRYYDKKKFLFFIFFSFSDIHSWRTVGFNKRTISCIYIHLFVDFSLFYKMETYYSSYYVLFTVLHDRTCLDFLLWILIFRFKWFDANHIEVCCIGFGFIMNLITLCASNVERRSSVTGSWGCSSGHKQDIEFPPFKKIFTQVICKFSFTYV